MITIMFYMHKTQNVVNTHITICLSLLTKNCTSQATANRRCSSSQLFYWDLDWTAISNTRSFMECITRTIKSILPRASYFYTLGIKVALFHIHKVALQRYNILKGKGYVCISQHIDPGFSVYIQEVNGTYLGDLHRHFLS